MLEVIKELINQKRNVFITGGGGVGKSYILKELKKIYPEMVITSTTGVSALNVDGQTIHSWSGIGMCERSERSKAAIALKSKEKAKELTETSLLAIDEISMLDAKTFKYLDDFLSIVRKNPKPFGGIQVILIGDFFQLPPVKLEMGAKYCFESPLWKKLNLATINLTKVYRQSDTELIEALNEIRKGDISEKHLNLIAHRNNIEPPIEAVRLYPKKEESDYYNYICFNKIRGEERIYWSNDKFYKGDKVINPYFDNMTQADHKDFEIFDDSCQIIHLLKLKIGARVMLLQNLDVSSGLVNGACGNVTSLNEKTVTVKFDNGVEKEIGKIRVNSYKRGKVVYSRTQIPLKLAYACTIHKVQGKTFDKIYVNLNNIFTAGQTYVALSRITALEGLYLKNFDEKKIKADERVINFYNELCAVKE